MTIYDTERFGGIAHEVVAEAIRSIDKHGEQGHLPMGTGPNTRPLEIYDDLEMLDGDMYAWALAKHATIDTKAHSANECGDNTCTWWLILREEVFEAAAEDDPAKLRAELVQVAAVALKMIDALDHRPSVQEPEHTNGSTR